MDEVGSSWLLATPRHRERLGGFVESLRITEEWQVRSVKGERYTRTFSAYTADVRLAVIRMVHVEDKMKVLPERPRNAFGVAARVRRKGKHIKQMQYDGR